jgi:hypothetical protein
MCQVTYLILLFTQYPVLDGSLQYSRLGKHAIIFFRL